MICYEMDRGDFPTRLVSRAKKRFKKGPKFGIFWKFLTFLQISHKCFPKHNDYFSYLKTTGKRIPKRYRSQKWVISLPSYSSFRTSNRSRFLQLLKRRPNSFQTIGPSQTFAKNEIFPYPWLSNSKQWSLIGCHILFH